MNEDVNRVAQHRDRDTYVFLVRSAECERVTHLGCL